MDESMGPVKGPSKGFVRAENLDPAQAAEMGRRFQPAIHEYIMKNFGDYQLPMSMRIRGFNEKQVLRGWEQAAVNWSVRAGRPLTEPEVVAITEHGLQTGQDLSRQSLVNGGIATFMTWRGQSTGRFPLWQPKLQGRNLDPAALSLPARFGLTTARFFAYLVATTIVLSPIAVGTEVSKLQTVLKDPRLAQLKEELLAAQRATRQGPGNMRPNQTPRQYQESNETNDIPRNLPNNRTTFPTSRASGEPQPSTAQWPAEPQNNDSGSFDELSQDADDASPIAPSSRSEGDSAGYRTWAQIRQQAQPSRQQPYRQPQQTAQDQSWGSSQSTSQWGADDADQEKASGREQAQKEFDELLERERQGAGQETSWSRK